MKGIFEIRNAPDLLEKLRRDHQRLIENPVDSDAAYNFFVTAHHMAEWAYPGDSGKQTRLRTEVPLLSICAHIANGAKHFEPNRHHSVSDTKREGEWFRGWGFEKWFSPGWGFQGRLVVYLDGEAREQLGESMTALDLAKKVLQFWEKEPSLAPRNPVTS